MLRHRLIFGVIFALALIGLLALDSVLDSTLIPAFLVAPFGERETFPRGMLVFPMGVAVAVLAGRELVEVLARSGVEASRRMTSGAAVLGVALLTFVPAEASGLDGALVVAGVTVLVLLAALVFYSRHERVQGVVAAAGGTLLAFAYVGLLLGFLVAIRREHSVPVLLWVLLTTKACDIGAYFTGRAIGRHKLIFWLSPGKTWEGLVGGIVFSTLVGAVGAELIGVRGGWTFGVFAGCVFGLTGQLGDLVASLLKRDAGIKDSSHILPGFGGILDMIDSPLLVAPVALWLLSLGS